MAGKRDGSDVWDISSPPITIDPLGPPEVLQGQLDRLAEVGRHRRAERWADFRQSLVIWFFKLGAVVIATALVASIVMLFRHLTDPVELAKWIMETLLGALVAGLIGFWAVKSFER